MGAPIIFPRFKEMAPERCYIFMLVIGEGKSISAKFLEQFIAKKYLIWNDLEKIIRLIKLTS